MSTDVRGTATQGRGLAKRLRYACAAALLVASAAVLSAVTGTAPAHATAAGTVLFQDDFNGSSVDTGKWFPGLHQISTTASDDGVVPENLSVHTVSDHGSTIGVLDAAANGDQYDDSQAGAVKGVHKIAGCTPIGAPSCYTRLTTGKRTGGLVWTNQTFGPARYEVRMKNLPLSGGCSCIWNYLETGSDYTEIDAEMPAHGKATGADWADWAGFNTYTGPDDAHATYLNTDLGAPQNDGNFHVYRWDWYDGTEGNGAKRIEFYVDNVLKATSTTNIPTKPAQLWVGNWPAPWSGDFAYATQHQYIDYVKITSLGSGGGGGSDTTAPTAPTNLTSPAHTATTADLTWGASTDNVGVTGYTVYNGTTVLTTVSGSTTSTQLTGLSPSTAYHLTVKATDAAGNLSPASNAITVTTNSNGGGGTGAVVNGDFEGTSFSPWTCAGSTAVVDGQGVGGSRAARLTPTGTTTAKCTQQITGLTPGATYTLSARLRVTGAEWIYAGTIVGDAQNERGTNATAYTTVTVPAFTAPATGKATVYISAWMQQTGATYADNITLQ
ncbi:fibronectin type III domain-containing protein [Actinacidiphila alni]|uniref:fibronectin type III domain-containing protein n=1 Tax=Actinacidiphila alni TaxID=380248 RepID=UPI003F5031D1